MPRTFFANVIQIRSINMRANGACVAIQSCATHTFLTCAVGDVRTDVCAINAFVMTAPWSIVICGVETRRAS
jgi:hypothetical protein